MDQKKYSRQILFPPIGAKGQEKLLHSRAVVVGCGALGTAHANALVRAGVGTVRLIDRDYVEASNLQRQLLFDEDDARQNLPKAVAAERRLRAINSGVRVEGIVADLDSGNVEKWLEGFEVILDGTDNFQTRYLLNDAAVKGGLPWIYGAAVGGYGMTFTILPGRSPCLACVFPSPPQGIQETCDTAGVIAPAVAWTSALQVTEALKILLGREQELHGSLMACDVWRNEFQQVRPRLDPECRVCQKREFDYLERGVPPPSALCGRDAVQIRPARERMLDLEQLRTRLELLGSVKANEYLLRASLDGCELTVFPDGRAIIKGTADPAVARSLYAKYIGS